jgi:4-nitrophenyl phosphatase
MDINKIKAFIFDMDGVLWRKYQPIGDLEKIFQTLTKKNIKYVFASNNASIHVNEYVKKMQVLGIPVEVQQIFTSGSTTAQVLKKRYPQGGKLYIVGEQGLKDTLYDYGFENAEENVLAVVGGLDFGITYEKISIAANLIRSGVPFIGTNPDRTFPTSEGQFPGAGTIIAAIQTASGKEPELIGKPQPTMFELALSSLGTLPDETLVIGDRLETDIAGGQAAGCRTAVVLTGVCTRQMAEAWKPSPDLIAEDLTEIVGML